MVEKRETKQKKIIEDLISSTKTFFTAEDIHNKLNKYNIGIATVYRFLKELRKKRKIHSFTCEGKNIYSKDGKNHCHFICERCGEKKHLELQKLDFLKNKIDEKICHFQIEVNGICNKCDKYIN